jgi:hypothetical protein
MTDIRRRAEDTPVAMWLSSWMDGNKDEEMNGCFACRLDRRTAYSRLEDGDRTLVKKEDWQTERQRLSLWRGSLSQTLERSKYICINISATVPHGMHSCCGGCVCLSVRTLRTQASISIIQWGRSRHQTHM